jgi:hypothetical protein
LATWSTKFSHQTEFPGPWLRRSGRWQGPGPALPPTWRQTRINQWIPIYESLGILHWLLNK